MRIGPQLNNRFRLRNVGQLLARSQARSWGPHSTTGRAALAFFTALHPLASGPEKAGKPVARALAAGFASAVTRALRPGTKHHRGLKPNAHGFGAGLVAQAL